MNQQRPKRTFKTDNPVETSCNVSSLCYFWVPRLLVEWCWPLPKISYCKRAEQQELESVSFSLIPSDVTGHEKSVHLWKMWRILECPPLFLIFFSLFLPKKKPSSYYYFSFAENDSVRQSLTHAWLPCLLFADPFFKKLAWEASFQNSHWTSSLNENYWVFDDITFADADLSAAWFTTDTFSRAVAFKSKALLIWRRNEFSFYPFCTEKSSDTSSYRCCAETWEERNFTSLIRHEFWTTRNNVLTLPGWPNTPFLWSPQRFFNGNLVQPKGEASLLLFQAILLQDSDF
jgi:hypothetical protein